MFLYVLVSSDKAFNNIVFVCKVHYHNYILNELGINSTFGNRIYTPAALSQEEILQNHASVLNTFNIPVSGTEEYGVPYLYWISKLHKNPYKQRYIAGSSEQPPVFTPHENIDSFQGATSGVF